MRDEAEHSAAQGPGQVHDLTIRRTAYPRRRISLGSQLSFLRFANSMRTALSAAQWPFGSHVPSPCTCDPHTAHGRHSSSPVSHKVSSLGHRTAIRALTYSLKDSGGTSSLFQENEGEVFVSSPFGLCPSVDALDLCTFLLAGGALPTQHVAQQRRRDPPLLHPLPPGGPNSSLSKAAYAVYCWAARNQGLLPVHSLRVADNERVESCPLTREEWKKLITAALPNFRIIPTLGHVDPQQDESGSGAPAKLWKSMITSSQQQPAGTDEAARLQEAFDDVLHIPVSAVEVAASSLKQLLSEHRVSSQTLRALDSCRQPQQLHAAVKLVWRKLPSATQAVVRADVREWVSMCAEAVPSTPTPADRFQFLQKCHAAINEAQAVSDWVTTALDLSTVLPRAVDPSPIAEVQCGRTFRAALIAISKQEDLTREHLRQALKGVQQVLEHAGAAPQPSQSYDWFLNDTATSAAGTAMVSPAAPPAVVERAVTALPTGPSPAKISSATSETSSAPSVTASSPVGAVIQPPVPPDARVLRANNLHRERTVQEYNALLSETMRPLTQFTSNDVARGFGHVYVSADTFDKYFSTVDSIDIHHPGGLVPSPERSF